MALAVGMANSEVLLVRAQVTLFIQAMSPFSTLIWRP